VNPSMDKSDELPENDVEWVKFWETPGSLAAEVIAGRLRADGIPAWVWQQGAGAAMGLTYGPLGRGHVMVPREELEHARKLMADGLVPAESNDDAPAEDLDPEDESEDGWFSKAILALTALAVSPLGVAAAFVVAKLFAGQADEPPQCPDCELYVDLDDDERSQGWFICPDCGRTVLI
jgi:hypothetical protein